MAEYRNKLPQSPDNQDLIDILSGKSINQPLRTYSAPLPYEMMDQMKPLAAPMMQPLGAPEPPQNWGGGYADLPGMEKPAYLRIMEMVRRLKGYGG